MEGRCPRCCVMLCDRSSFGILKISSRFFHEILKLCLSFSVGLFFFSFDPMVILPAIHFHLRLRFKSQSHSSTILEEGCKVTSSAWWPSNKLLVGGNSYVFFKVSWGDYIFIYKVVVSNNVLFLLLPEEMIQFDFCIYFQMGWLVRNHQLPMIFQGIWRVKCNSIHSPFLIRLEKDPQELEEDFFSCKVLGVTVLKSLKFASKNGRLVALQWVPIVQG